MKLTINNHEYEFKYTIRAMFIYEQITGHSFNIDTTLDQYIFMYSMLLANNPDNIVSWDDFIDELDNNPKLMFDFLDYLNAYSESRNIFRNPEEETDDTDEKKN